MTSLRHRMLEDLQLRGLAPRTQQCYIEAVKHLSQHYRRAPDQLNEEEIRQYFLYYYSGKYSLNLVSWFQTHRWRMEPCSNPMFQVMS
jgi:Phage integrase, N-terminal SAM-like domain